MVVVIIIIVVVVVVVVLVVERSSYSSVTEHPLSKWKVGSSILPRGNVDTHKCKFGRIDTAFVARESGDDRHLSSCLSKRFASVSADASLYPCHKSCRRTMCLLQCLTHFL